MGLGAPFWRSAVLKSKEHAGQGELQGKLQAKKAWCQLCVRWRACLNRRSHNLLPSVLLQASCWGVSWYQPFVQLPRLSASAGHEALSPQGAFTVAVQPPLPLIKVRRQLEGCVCIECCYLLLGCSTRCLHCCRAAAVAIDQGASHAAASRVLVVGCD
jgi:hypothetical protein